MRDDQAPPNALTLKVSQLPARAELVQRGLALAGLLGRRAKVKQHMSQAWEAWVNYHDDENPESAISAFNNGVMATAAWLGVERQGSITDLARELMQKPEWRREVERRLEKWKEFEREIKQTQPERELTFDYEPWIRGGMEELIANIDKLNSGVHLADVGWTGSELIMELMLFFEEISDWFDPSRVDTVTSSESG